jgi:eukaryotic-like serine/threonine-protein kinase
MTATVGSSYHVGPDDQPDKYRLLQQVGRGGEAQLWQGELAVAGGVEPVAIKIRSQTEGDFARSAQRWNEQAELLRFIRHPGVVGVREHFEGAHFHLRGQVAEARDRALYLVMNWVDGVPLHEWAQRPGAELHQALRHLEQVADVLDELHSGQATPSRRPVIHGDLSPGNIMISPTGQAMLVDFGLVRVVAHRTERAAGTPGYAAPEVWHSGAYSPAADRYAFGAVAWFALTGTAPPPNPAELRGRLLSLPLTAGLSPDEAAQLGSIFADRPEQRPHSLVDWTHLLRRGVRSSAARPVTGNGGPVWPGVPPTSGPDPYRPAAPTTAGPTAPATEQATRHVTAQAGLRTAPPARRPRRLGRTIGILAAALVVAMIGGLILGYRLFAGQGGTGTGTTAPTTPVAAPAQVDPAAPTPEVVDPAPSGTSAGSSGAGGAVTSGVSVAPLPPGGSEVRRRTGADRIRLAPGYAVDLDSLADDWAVQRGNGDLYLEQSGTQIDVQNGDLSPVSGTTADYATCARATTYYSRVDLRNLTVPSSYCVRTSENRYAFFAVLDTTGPVVLDVTVWDPPRPA